MTLEKKCDNCSAEYTVKHELPEDYMEQFCPFCGHEHEEEVEVKTDIDEDWDWLQSKLSWSMYKH